MASVSFSFLAETQQYWYNTRAYRWEKATTDTYLTSTRYNGCATVSVQAGSFKDSLESEESTSFNGVWIITSLRNISVQLTREDLVGYSVGDDLQVNINTSVGSFAVEGKVNAQGGLAYSESSRSFSGQLTAGSQVCITGFTFQKKEACLLRLQQGGSVRVLIQGETPSGQVQFFKHFQVPLGGGSIQISEVIPFTKITACAVNVDNISGKTLGLGMVSVRGKYISDVPLFTLSGNPEEWIEIITNSADAVLINANIGDICHNGIESYSVNDTLELGNYYRYAETGLGAIDYLLPAIHVFSVFVPTEIVFNGFEQLSDDDLCCIKLPPDTPIPPVPPIPPEPPEPMAPIPIGIEKHQPPIPITPPEGGEGGGEGGGGVEPPSTPSTPVEGGGGPDDDDRIIYLGENEDVDISCICNGLSAIAGAIFSKQSVDNSDELMSISNQLGKLDKLDKIDDLSEDLQDKIDDLKDELANQKQSLDDIADRLDGIDPTINISGDDVETVLSKKTRISIVEGEDFRRELGNPEITDDNYQSNDNG